MLGKDKRIRIITGHYGSGKTEFAVNYAVALKKTEKYVALADLDIVNVYFRSREQRKALEDKGIKVIASSIKGDNADLPSLSPEISHPVQDKSYNYIIDLGGNDVGTLTLARLRSLLNQDEVELLMVVNTNRPDTSTTEKIITQKTNLERSVGYHVTGFVNNTNLVRESTAENLFQGDKTLKEVSKFTGIPIKYTSYVEEAMDKIPENVSGNRIPLEFYMRKDWM